MVGRAVRRGVFDLHAWLGLHASLLLALLFLSGTLLVLADDLLPLLDGRMRAGPAGAPVSFGEILDRIRADRPDLQPLAIERAVQGLVGDRTTAVTADGTVVAVWTDPATGALVGITPDTGVKEILRGLHDSLLVPHRIGVLLVTSAALLLLFQIVSGLVTFRRFWRGFLRLPGRAAGGRSFWGGLHRLLALWSLPFLLAIGLTGTVFFLSEAGFHAELPELPGAPARETALPAGFDGAALDRTVAAAMAAAPGLRPAYVRLPEAPDEALVLFAPRGLAAGTPDAIAASVDPATGTLLGLYRGADLGLHRQIINLSDTVHFAAWGGLAVRLVWAAGGLAATALALSGAGICAARLATGPGAARTAVGRIWGAMSVLKWGIPLLLLAVAAIGLWRFGGLRPQTAALSAPVAEPLRLARAPRDLPVAGQDV